MSLFDDLRYNRIQQGLRLEQEYIGYQWLESVLRLEKDCRKSC
jgi:hypothetical protein